MSTNEWIDGPPPEEDGLYAIMRRTQGWVISRELGAWFCDDNHWTYAEVKGSADRYCRLPDVPKPLPLPRRFRAKKDGLPVVGIRYMHNRNQSSCYCYIDANGRSMWVAESALDAIEWMDPEETA